MRWGQHPRLAAPSARQDQQRAVTVRDGIALRVVETFEERVDALFGDGVIGHSSSIDV